MFLKRAGRKKRPVRIQCAIPQEKTARFSTARLFSSEMACASSGDRRRGGKTGIFAGRGSAGDQFGLKSRERAGGQGKEERLEQNDGFTKAGVHVVMNFIEAEPGIRRLRAGGQIVADAAEFGREVGDHNFEDAQLVQQARASTEENVVHELIPVGALAGAFAAKKGWIQRKNRRNHSRMAPDSTHGAAAGFDGLGKPGNGAGGNIGALASANEFAFGAERESVVESDGKNRV